MNDKSRNGLLIAVAIIAVIGWVFALSDFKGVNSEVNEDNLTEEEARIFLERKGFGILEPSQTTVYYGFDNNGSVVPCIVTEGGNTSTVKIYLENNGPDAVVDFMLSAKNADVSLDASSGFKPSSNKTITVLEGTQYDTETFYVRPHPNADNLSLTLDAKAIDPTDTRLVYTLPFSNTIVFFEDQSGNYCLEVRD